MKKQIFASFIIALLGAFSSNTIYANTRLGVSQSYNAFFLENFSSTATDSHRRIAAGGDVSLDSYGVASVLPS